MCVEKECDILSVIACKVNGRLLIHANLPGVSSAESDLGFMNLLDKMKS